MQFFIPKAKRGQKVSTYEEIVTALKSQLRCDITDRRIFSMEYDHDKHHYRAEVGQLEQIQNRYKIMAILEANLFIIYTQDRKGEDALIIMVNKDEVTAVQDFS